MEMNINQLWETSMYYIEHLNAAVPSEGEIMVLPYSKAIHWSSTY